MPHTATLLIVEDHDDNRDMLAEYLTALGFSVATAANGVDAVRLAEQLQPAVVLMDIGLPGTIDGCEATRRIKAQPACAGCHVVAVTGFATAAHLRRAEEAGCERVWIKPYELRTLADYLTTLVTSRAPQLI